MNKDTVWMILGIILLAIVATGVLLTPLWQDLLQERFVDRGNTIGCDVPEGSTCYIRNPDINVGWPARTKPLSDQADMPNPIGAVTTYRLMIADARSDRTNEFLDTLNLNSPRLPTSLN